MAAFEDVLRARGYEFSSMLDQSGRDELLAFIESMSDDSGGTLSYAELDSILDAYKNVGIIVPAGSGGRQSPGDIFSANEDSDLIDGLKNISGMYAGSAAENSADGSGRAPDDLSAGISGLSGRNGAPERHPAEPKPAYAGRAAENGLSSGPVITWQIITSNIHEASVSHPIMVLRDPEGLLRHHQTGDFAAPQYRTSFECRVQSGGEERLVSADILYIDKRFIKLLNWLGSGRIYVRLSGRPTAEGYAVYKIHAEDPNGNDTLRSANDSFLQFNIRRLLASDAPEDPPADEEDGPADDDHMLLTDMASMIDFLSISGDTLPADIRSWAHRNIALIRTETISPEEKRHAQRALSLMLNIQWKGGYFESVDPVEARRILDEELYGMENVKQRVIETIIQINRTHTLPAYGLLLVGPAGTGKSQIAYAVARILKLPWAALDMSAIHDAEALTGSPRVYSNAKPGRIMEAFSQAGSSNIVFIINELDKAEGASSSGNPADALLTLLDNLGYTDNYIECVIPTGGVYPIATANDKSQISDPLLTRFAVIDIPDYTPEEKAIIFTQFSMPKILRRMGMNADELTVTGEAVDLVIEHYKNRPGVRDLEQAAEHMAANALYQIETTGAKTIVFDAEKTRQILEG